MNEFKVNEVLLEKEVEYHKQNARDYLLECIKLQSELDKALQINVVLKHRLKMVSNITGE